MRQKQGIILFFLIFSLFFACTHFEEEKEVSNDIQVPDQESFFTLIVLTREGKKMAEVWATRVQSFSQKKETLLKDSIHVDFFDRDGTHKSVLTADEGIIYTATNDMVAVGHVIVVSDSGLILKTERLRWKNQIQRVIADTNVVFTRGVSHRKVQVE